ncbi:MAG TPA: alpha/beta hydrolase [Burkholderiaceae bacterium]|jgi:pimeloyl-ACP methyl ester carboxylesterase|nr:alpha/beta hydrolase [Burkholderiaceae bacterium]
MLQSQRIPLLTWRDAGSYFDYRGHAIFYRVDGLEGGEPLLLIHGFPTASWDWEGMWETLGKRYRLYTLDMIGFGFSAKPKHYDYRIADQADIHETLLRKFQVTHYHVLAHDYGDTIAQELLARQGEPGSRPSMRTLCLTNGGLFPETHRALLMQKLLLSPLGPLLVKFLRRDKFAKSMQHIFGKETAPDDALIDDFWTLMTHHNGLAVFPKLIRYIIERRENRERWVGALQKSQIPIKLIDGAVDPISGMHMVKRYRELIPRPNVTVLEKIGHYPQCEDAPAVLAAYEEFRAAFS